VALNKKREAKAKLELAHKTDKVSAITHEITEVSWRRIYCCLSPPLRQRFCDLVGLSHSSVCHSVDLKRNRPISLKLDVMIGPTSRKSWLTFGGDPILDTESGLVCHFPHHCGMGDFRTFISSSHTHRPIFTTLSEITDADKVMNM